MEMLTVNNSDNEGKISHCLSSELNEKLKREFYDLLKDLKYILDSSNGNRFGYDLVSEVSKLQEIDFDNIGLYGDTLMRLLLITYVQPETKCIVKRIAEIVVEKSPIVAEIRNKSTFIDAIIAKETIDKFKENHLLSDDEKIGIDILKDIDGCPVLICSDFAERSKSDESFASEYLPVYYRVHRKVNEHYKSLLDKEMADTHVCR